MNEKDHEKATIRRLYLAIFIVACLIGAFCPAFISARKNGYSILTIDGYFIINVCKVLFILVPILHLAKLMGLFGESKRNSRALGVLLSVLELAGILTAYVWEYVMSVNHSSEHFSLADYFGRMTVWGYLWVVIAIITIVLSIMYLPVTPVLRAPAETKESTSLDNKENNVCNSECQR